MQNKLYRHQIQIQLQITEHSNKTNVFSLLVVNLHHFQIIPPRPHPDPSQHPQPSRPSCVLLLKSLHS
jgi:hypothetical protein